MADVSDRDERGTSERPSEPSSDVTEPVEPTTPLLKVVNPDATPEEIAAIVAVFSALGSATEDKTRTVREWNAPHRQVRPHYSHGPGGWRSSGLPKHRGRGN